MRAWVRRRRRSSTTTKARSGAMARGLTRGRDDASRSPASPWARKRPSHFRAVGALTPCAAPAAAGVSLTLDHVLNHFLSTSEGESGILVDVHSAELLKGCGLGRTSQSLRLSPDGQKQRIEASHLGRKRRRSALPFDLDADFLDARQRRELGDAQPDSRRAEFGTARSARRLR